MWNSTSNSCSTNHPGCMYFNISIFVMVIKHCNAQQDKLLVATYTLHNFESQQGVKSGIIKCDSIFLYRTGYASLCGCNVITGIRSRNRKKILIINNVKPLEQQKNMIAVLNDCDKSMLRSIIHIVCEL